MDLLAITRDLVKVVRQRLKKAKKKISKSTEGTTQRNKCKSTSERGGADGKRKKQLASVRKKQKKTNDNVCILPYLTYFVLSCLFIFALNLDCFED